jgi:hypothetical protein
MCRRRPNKEKSKPESVAVREKKRAREPDVVKEWRKRMASGEGVAVMERRGRIERVNAQLKSRGLGSLLVRGLVKVQAVALWHTLGHNLVTALRLRAASAVAIVVAA